MDALARPAETATAIADEQAAHAGSPFAYAAHFWRMWRDLVSEWLVWSVIAAVCTMLIGLALWTWGIIQGPRDRGFYLRLLLGRYDIGLTLPGVRLAGPLPFSPGPTH